MLARHSATPSFREGARAQKVGPLRSFVGELLLCFMAFSAHRDVSRELNLGLQVCWAATFSFCAGCTA